MQPSLKPPLTTAQKQQRYRVWHDADPERRVICRKSKKNGEKTWRLTKRRQLKTLVRGESIYNGESGGLPQEQGQERNFDKLDHPSRQPAAIPSAVPRAVPKPGSSRSGQQAVSVQCIDYLSVRSFRLNRAKGRFSDTPQSV